MKLDLLSPLFFMSSKFGWIVLYLFHKLLIHFLSKIYFKKYLNKKHF